MAWIEDSAKGVLNLQTALHYARNRIDDAIKVVVKVRGVTEVREKTIA